MAGIFLAGMVLFASLAVYLQKTNRYRVTWESVNRSKGIWGQSERVLPVKEIESVHIRQGPIDRLFGIGTVVMETKNGRSERLGGIREPQVVRRKIAALI
jgi:membrane protein YdbS with pleckstrin-like domain